MSDSTSAVSANLVDISSRTVQPAELVLREGRIAEVRPLAQRQATYVLPGFIDAHLHIESSMLVPREFARAAVVHGTIGVVCDPHEIANVLGLAGVEYMLRDAADVPFHFHFGAPSCVPATQFETAGAALGVAEVTQLLSDPRIGYLSEVMNFPGVLAGEEEVLAKIAAAQARNKPVDGHAPGLRDSAAQQYIAAGISTDHECCELEEAQEKLAAGCKIAIREGSAARNFDALCTLIETAPEQVMLCSDDKHPDELVAGHIDRLVHRAVAAGIDRWKALQVACLTPRAHYGLSSGILRAGDSADFIEVESLESLAVIRTFIRGEVVAECGGVHIPRRTVNVVNRFATRPQRVDEFRVPASAGKLQVIGAEDGQLITRRVITPAHVVDGAAVSDPSRDLLKIAVVNRYRESAPSVAFVRGFGLQRGAIASSVAHDSHNIVAVGTNDVDLCAAVNLVIEAEGGLAAVAGAAEEVLPLPVAGLMSTDSATDVATRYARLDQRAKEFGSSLRAPFMTLSFMALLVIPELKLSDRGLFDVHKFRFTESLFV